MENNMIVVENAEIHSDPPKAPLWRRIQRFVPAVAFVGGFLWDTVTLGKVVTSTDLWILGLYYLGAFLAVVLILPERTRPWHRYISFFMQFCYGGLFSALVVFYFKSSGAWPGFLVVVGLCALLILNEFIHTRYTQLAVSWSLLCVVGIMYLNFVLPHLVHGIGAFWFVLSTVLGFSLILIPWKLSRRNIWFLLPPFAVTLAIGASYFAGMIPPVPLVVKQQMVCKQFERDRGAWICMEPESSVKVRLGLAPTSVYHATEEKIHYLSSVFAPSHVRAHLEHRWYVKDSLAGWQMRDTIPFDMVGGREEGWRLNSHKVTLYPGLWRVETALRGGAVVGRMEFTIPAVPEPDGVRYKRKELR